MDHDSGTLQQVDALGRLVHERRQTTPEQVEIARRAMLQVPASQPAPHRQSGSNAA